MTTRTADGTKPVALYLRLKEQVRERIRTSGKRDGERFMTLQELSRYLGVSPGTANKVVAALQEEGVLRARRGSGIYVCRQAASTSTCIGLLVPSLLQADHPYLTGLLAGLEDQAGRTGYDVAVFTVKSGTFSDQTNHHLNRLVEHRIVCGLIAPPALIGPEEYRWLLNREIAVVLRGPYKDPEVWSVDEYPADSHRDVLDFLTGLGHRRIGLVQAVHRVHDDVDERRDPPDASTEWRVLTWRENMAIHREYASAGKIAGDEGLMMVHDNRSDSAVDEVCRWYLAHSNRPTAMILTDTLFAERVIARLREAGVRTPEDVSVLARGPVAAASELTTWEVPLDSVARSCVRLIHRQLTGDTGGAHRENVYGRIRRGGTVRAYSEV